MCKDRNVPQEYLESREQEVVDRMMTLFDDEQILKAYTKDIKDSTAKETARETARETAERMIKMGKLSLEEVATCVPSISIEELKEMEAEIMQLA